MRLIETVFLEKDMHAWGVRVMCSVCIHLLGWSLAHYHPISYKFLSTTSVPKLLAYAGSSTLLTTYASTYIPLLWIQYILFTLILYMTASMLEWFIHRNIMHFSHGSDIWRKICTNISKSHRIHHQSLIGFSDTHSVPLSMSMSIRTAHSDEELLFDTRMMVNCGVAIMLWMFGVIWVLRLDYLPWYAPFVGSILMVGLYTATSNTIHPLMHNMYNPNALLRHIIHHLPQHHIWVRNHAHHHITSRGQRNFNIVYLGIDPIMGTYIPIFRTL